jgi:hypothetical protein
MDTVVKKRVKDNVSTYLDKSCKSPRVSGGGFCS